MGSSLIEEIKDFYKKIENSGKDFVNGKTYIDYNDACELLQYIEINEQGIESNEQNSIINELLLQEVKKLREEVEHLKYGL